MNGNLKRPYRKEFRPVGWDVWDPTIVTGRRIDNCAVVTVTQHNGPFRTIADEYGNVMAVGRNSLVPVKGKR